MTIGDRMKRRRKILGITQEELYESAKKLDPAGIGISQQMISKLERGDSSKTTNILLLARALKCNPAWLDTGTGHEELIEVNEPAQPYTVTHDLIMQQALEIADGVEAKLGIKANPDEKWFFIQNVAALLREKYTRDNIPFNKADIIDIAVALERTRKGIGGKDNDNESAAG